MSERMTEREQMVERMQKALDEELGEIVTTLLLDDVLERLARRALAVVEAAGASPAAPESPAVAQGRTPSGVDVKRLVSKALKDYQAGMSVRMVVNDAVRAALLLGATDQDSASPAVAALQERIAELERYAAGLQIKVAEARRNEDTLRDQAQALETENARLREQVERWKMEAYDRGYQP